MGRKMTVKQMQNIGQDFIDHLEESGRGHIADRKQLTEIYNKEFRSRDCGAKDPQLGRIIFSLSKSKPKMALICGPNVILNPKERMLAQDQWHLPGLTRMVMSTLSPRPVNCIPAQVSTDQVSTDQVSTDQVSTDQVSTLSPGPVSDSPAHCAQVSPPSTGPVNDSPAHCAQVSPPSTGPVNDSPAHCAQVSPPSTGPVDCSPAHCAQVSPLSTGPVNCDPAAQVSTAQESTLNPEQVNCSDAQVSSEQVSILSPEQVNCNDAQVSSEQVSTAQESTLNPEQVTCSDAQVSSAPMSTAQVSTRSPARPVNCSPALESSARESTLNPEQVNCSDDQVSSAQVSTAQESSAQVSTAQESSAQVSTAQESTLNPEQVNCSPAHVSSAEPLESSACPGGDAETAVLARRNLARLLMDRLAANKAQFISDRCGIAITSDHELKDGTVRFHVEGLHEYVARFYIENSGSSPVYFTYYSTLHHSYFTLQDEQKVSRTNPLQIGPGASYEIQVLFHSGQVGFYPATLAFEFKADLLPSCASFHIVRFIEAQRSTFLARELAPTAPYKPRSMAGLTAEPLCTIEDGQRPECPSGSLEHVVALTNYRIPQYVRDLTLMDKHPSLTSHRKDVLDARAVLESPLSRQNYTERFQLLLYLEELQMTVDMKKFNMAETPLMRDQHDQKLIALVVPGVSENRPSLLRGDQLLVRPSGEAGGAGAGGEVLKYRGYIHRVEQEQVKLGFSAKLLATLVAGMKFSVEFTVNRMTMRLQHRAIDLVSQHSLLEVLFPTARTPSEQQQQLPTLSLYDRQLEDNPEQYAAVQHIVAQSSKPAPYLVFGPPGTGKTVTVVEAIKQIEKTQGSCHILACAPSNSATDLLCKKIVEHVDKHKVFRMYASSRDPRDVPIQLLGCCNLEGDSFVFPSTDTLMQYKIVATTLLTAGRLVTGGVPPGHFTHIFLDEAGQAMETECILPLAGLLQTTSTQLVLAGDPNQLGPIVRSPLAMKHGMTLSLLERLMKHVDLYLKDERGEFAKRFVTKLLRNYRSHPAILNIPNELFYDGELQVFANEIIRNSYCRWEHLPKTDFPVIFHGVTGIDEREANSPSFFNVAEVQMLMDYLKKILETQGKNGQSTIEPKDIGIVAPYRKQVEKIRKALKSVENSLKIMNMKDLKVGSVEEFQGQERKVMLVSTVRSSPNYVELDQQFSLGFVKNVKRFNVTVTRAKALLIVVGNPRVLKTDPTWARFIQYCSDEGGYAGFPHTEDEEEVVSRLADLYIHMQPKVATAESVVQLQPAPEWRNEH